MARDSVHRGTIGGGSVEMPTTLRIAAAACLIVLTAACSSSDPASLKQEARTTLNSAVVTLDAWLAKDAPAHYASQTLDAAGESLAGTITQIEGLEPTQAEALATWALPLHAAREEIASASKAIGNDNAAVVQSHRQALASAVQQLTAAPPPPAKP